MNITSYGTAEWDVSQQAPAPVASKQPLHRLRMVRCQQGFSRRKVARLMNVSIQQVRYQECETTDLPLSVLYAWRKVLDVPVAEMLVEAGDSLVSPILERSQLLRLMKTVLTVRERARQESIRRMAQTMCGQLLEIMPELANVQPWHAVGKRRRPSELGTTAQRCLVEDVFLDDGEWSVE
jgi:transcriptional regulator with XRE-family HTH domain